MINKDNFWTEYRLHFGKIKNPKTIEVVERIIEYAKSEGLLNNQIAYILATAYHETAFDFIPKREFGSSEYFIRKYWNNLKVRKWLGNDSAAEAVKYCGRGLVQITGEVNYERFGIADNPEKALETETAVKILVDGMVKGVFTGRRLNHYLTRDKTDFISARKIINGTDKAHNISVYANKFLRILE